jgi:hypothetical protein
MRATKRLTEFDRSLSPQGAVLRWIATVQGHPTDDAYIDAVSGTSGWRPPLEGMLAAMDDTVRRARVGQTPEEIAYAVRRARGDLLLLFHLALGLNRAAIAVAVPWKVEAGLLWIMGKMLEQDPDSWEPEPGDRDPEDDPLGRNWRFWKDMVTLLLDRVAVEEGARVRLEGCYFHARPVLFPDEAGAWEELRATIAPLRDQLATLRDQLATLPPHLVARAARVTVDWPLPDDSVADRVAARAGELADDARVDAFEWLGEPERGLRILDARRWRARHPASEEPLPRVEQDGSAAPPPVSRRRSSEGRPRARAAWSGGARRKTLRPRPPSTRQGGSPDTPVHDTEEGGSPDGLDLGREGSVSGWDRGDDG